MTKSSKTEKRKLVSKFSSNDADELKENMASSNLKKIRFVKKSSLNNLA